MLDAGLLVKLGRLELWLPGELFLVAFLCALLAAMNGAGFKLCLLVAVSAFVAVELLGVCAFLLGRACGNHQRRLRDLLAGR